MLGQFTVFDAYEIHHTNSDFLPLSGAPKKGSDVCSVKSFSRRHGVTVGELLSDFGSQIRGRRRGGGVVDFLSRFVFHCSVPFYISFDYSFVHSFG